MPFHSPAFWVSLLTPYIVFCLSVNCCHIKCGYSHLRVKRVCFPHPYCWSGKPRPDGCTASQTIEYRENPDLDEPSCISSLKLLNELSRSQLRSKTWSFKCLLNLNCYFFSKVQSLNLSLTSSARIQWFLPQDHRPFLLWVYPYITRD